MTQRVHSLKRSSKRKYSRGKYSNNYPKNRTKRRTSRRRTSKRRTSKRRTSRRRTQKRKISRVQVGGQITKFPNIAKIPGVGLGDGFNITMLSCPVILHTGKGFNQKKASARLKVYYASNQAVESCFMCLSGKTDDDSVMENNTMSNADFPNPGHPNSPGLDLTPLHKKSKGIGMIGVGKDEYRITVVATGKIKTYLPDVTNIEFSENQSDIFLVYAFNFISERLQSGAGAVQSGHPPIQIPTHTRIPNEEGLVYGVLQQLGADHHAIPPGGGAPVVAAPAVQPVKPAQPGDTGYGGLVAPGQVSHALAAVQGQPQMANVVTGGAIGQTPVAAVVTGGATGQPPVANVVRGGTTTTPPVQQLVSGGGGAAQKIDPTALNQLVDSFVSSQSRQPAPNYYGFFNTQAMDAQKAVSRQHPQQRQQQQQQQQTPGGVFAALSQTNPSAQPATNTPPGVSLTPQGVQQQQHQPTSGGAFNAFGSAIPPPSPPLITPPSMPQPQPMPEPEPAPAPAAGGVQGAAVFGFGSAST